MKSLLWSSALLSIWVCSSLAQAGQPAAPTHCTRTANLLACSDALGNGYSVFSAGDTLYLRGYEVQGKRTWAQTNSRYGHLTFFTGLTSDGEAWVGYSLRVGWTTINRFASSSGDKGKFSCNRMGGCQ